jgi:hypothetical protein
MTQETWVIIIKGIGVVLGTALTTFVGSLSQWSNETASPSEVQWLIIFGAALASGFITMGAFMSTAFKDYKDQRNGNGAPVQPPAEAKPVAPTAPVP